VSFRCCAATRRFRSKADFNIDASRRQG
jgi:hypothetical protein